MNYLSKNLQVIAKRWPDLARMIENTPLSPSQVELVADHQRTLVFEQIQIASSFDQIAEAQIQIHHIADNCTEVSVYGTGLGAVQSQLLARDKLVSLHVFILNLALFKASLIYFQQQSWLSDPRVQLAFAEHSTKPLRMPFVALPAELTLACDATAVLRDRLCLTLDADFIERSSGAKNQTLIAKISNNSSFIEQDHDVRQLFASGNTEHYIICGAGPTLVEHYQWLKSPACQNNYTLIAVDAAVAPLYQEGIIPDFIVSIDPKAKHLFTGFYEQVPLVYFPVVDADFIASWPGQRFVAYSTGRLYDAINKLIPRGRLYCGGSVIHPAIDLAVNMRAKNIILLGADFSFPGGLTHAHWQEDSAHLSANKAVHWVLNAEQERVPTLLNYRGYLRDLEQFIAQTTGVNFYNGSKKGALIAGTKIWEKTDVR